MSSIGTPLKQPRPKPEDFGVTMGTPSRNLLEHARDRLTQQMRVFSLLYLMRLNGMISPLGKVSLAKTEVQHGQGDIGEQAAHKVIASLAIDGKSMLDLCSADRALYTFMVYLLAETTILPRGYNMADQELEETGGLRDQVITLAQFIVSGAHEGAYSEFDKFKACMMNTFATLHSFYLQKCEILRKWMLEGFALHHRDLEKIKSVKVTPQNETFLEDESRKRMTNCQDDLYKMIALDVYLEAVLTMDFPLLDAELENMFEVVMGREPARGFSASSSPTQIPSNSSSNSSSSSLSSSSSSLKTFTNL